MTGEGFTCWLPEEEPAVHAEEILALLVLQRVQLNKSDGERNKNTMSREQQPDYVLQGLYC